MHVIYAPQHQTKRGDAVYETTAAIVSILTKTPIMALPHASADSKLQTSDINCIVHNMMVR